MDNDIYKYFGYNKPFTSKQLYEFYCRYEGSLNKNTFRWRVHKLKQQGKISSIGRGIYILEEKINFNYTITSEIKRIFNSANKLFPDENMCIWSTNWLNNYMNHQPFNYFIILEVDKDVIDIVFQELKGKFNKIYLNPRNNQIDNYILDENAIIIKPIVKEAPVEIINKIKVPKIEKILVDLFFESSLLIMYQGQEMKNIFYEIFNKYTINLTTLYRYAKNRGIKDKIETFLINDIQIENKYLREVQDDIR